MSADASFRTVGLPTAQVWLDALPLPAWLCDGDDVVMAHNAQAAVLWGGALRVGESDDGLPVVPAPAASWAQAATGPVAGVEVKLLTAAGERQRALANVSRLTFDPKPDVEGDDTFLKTLQITASEDTEDFFENGVLGMRLVAGDGTILRANRAELALLGYRVEEYVGHNLTEFDADGGVLARLLERIRAGETIDSHPARLIGSDGRVRPVQISSSGRFHGGTFLHSHCFTVDVSPQDALRQEALERDRLAQQLLQALPIAVYTTDVEGNITFFNDAAAELLGRRPLPGEKWCASLKLFQPDGTPMSHEQCPMAVAVRERRPMHGETGIAERPDGRRITFEAYPTPLFDEHDSLLGAVSILIDITEQQESQQAAEALNTRLKRRVAERTRMAEATFMHLHRSEREFRLLVANVTDYAIFMLDPQGIVTTWNAGAERIKGYRADEIVGQHFSSFYPEEERARGTPAAALATARREGHYLAEGWRIRKNGSRFWASVVIDPVLDDGKLIGFAKVTRDITERRIAEAALVESEQLARGVIDTALDGFAQLNEDGHIVQWNPRAQAMFGWSRKEALGQSLLALVVAPAARERFSDELQPANRRSAWSITRRLDMQTRAGSQIPVELSVSSLTVDGQFRTNVFIRDLSEKILIEAQLRQAQKMEAVGQLTSGLAHDFNNLLQGVIGSLDLIRLRVGAGDTSDVDRFVQGALNSANRAAAMTHRLLAFSRRQPLDPRPLQANTLVWSMADLLRRTVGETVTITFELAPELWPTLCDPNQLESALLNLVINARDAMPGGGQLFVRSRNVDSEAADANGRPEVGEGQYICIEVADDGDGMSAEVQEHAFEPFFTTKAAGQGTGLGLSMVYGFARQSNGHCDIRSEPGGGTTIRLNLPRHLGVLKKSTEVPNSGAPFISNGELVLVVEDEQVVRRIVVEVLHELGYAALEAPDAESALMAAQARDDIHMLISDIGLPGMDGRQLADTLRERWPQMKVLLMTGYAAAVSSSKGFDAGMELITKPFTVHSLAERLRGMMPGVARADGA